MSNLRKTFPHALLITFLALLFYQSTIAPTVLWGDDAELQWRAVLREPNSGIRSYWLYIFAAHEFSKLPFGDVAWRVNLFSAVFAALTIGVMFVNLRIAGCSLRASWTGCTAMAVSHTFWLHAVRAEVYSLLLFVLSLIILLLLSWHKNPKMIVFLSIGLLLIGTALLIHMIILTLIPAVAALIILSKKENVILTNSLAAISTIIGLLPYLLTSQSSYSQVSLSDALSGLLQIGIKDIFLWIAFLGYQFALLTPVGIWGSGLLWKESRTLSLFLVSAFLGNVVWALSFNVPDKYVFYMPSYLIFTIWIGKGLDNLQKHLFAKIRRFQLIIILLTLSPLPIYTATPAVLNRLGINLLSVRTLPYRDNNFFFLNPPKNGYYGSRIFGETVMNSLPHNAAVLADHSPLQTLIYLQKVEGRRQDIILSDTYPEEGQISWLLRQSETRPVFIADNESAYYEIEEISSIFYIKPFGPIFLLEKKPRERTWIPCQFGCTCVPC